MDAKPIRTHRAAYRGMRIPGMIAFLAGATICAAGAVLLIVTLLDRLLFHGISDYWIWYLVAFALVDTFGIVILAAGLVLLAMSEKMRIIDGEKGFDYQKL